MLLVLVHSNSLKAVCIAELCYNNTGICNTSSTVPSILTCQLVPQKALVLLSCSMWQTCEHQPPINAMPIMVQT